VRIDPSVAATTDYGREAVATVAHDRVGPGKYSTERNSAVGLSLEADFEDRAEKGARAA
jgi:imidazoleglycerol phosphate synthase glutamine amidotransferase subunit HisH